MASQSFFGLSAVRASAPPRAPSPSDRGSGMYISGGGGFVSSRSNVGLWQGRGADMGRSFCGGTIGKAGHKMCIISGCGIAAHVGRKAEFPTEEDVVFIACSTMGTSGDEPQSVHLDPWVRASSLGHNLERYMEERRSVLDWETLFRGLNSLDEGSTTRSQLEEDLDRLSKKLDVELAESKTPFKKRTKLEVVSPPEEFASVAEFAVEIIEELGQDFVNDGSLRVVVRQLSDGLHEIVTRAETNRNAIRTLSHETRDEFEMVDVKLSKIHSLLGKRGRDDGTLSAFGVLQDLEKQVEALKTVVQPAVELAAVAASEAAKQKQEIFEAMQTACNPLFQLFLKLSSDEHRPGDLMDRKFQKLESEVARWSARAAGEGGGDGDGRELGGGRLEPSPLRTATFGLSGMPSVSSGRVVSPTRTMELETGGRASTETRGTDARFNALEARLLELSNQLQAKSVSIAGRIFKSRAEVKSWLALHARAVPAYVFFVDVHSLMALKLGTTLEDAAADADFESKVRKNGYTTIDEANVASSFSRSLPSFFGKPTPTESRKLPALKTADAWEPKTMVDGARAVLDRLLVAAGRELQSVSMDFLHGEGLLVAQSCLQTAVKFVTDLSTWMSREYVELLKRGGSEVECWGLIAHCVRAVFEDLHEARMPGRGPHLTAEDRAASSIWGCFQAHLKMQEFEKLGFAAHPTLSHILNIHLRDHTVSKATFEKLLARTTALEGNAATAASGLRVLQSAVGEVKKAGKGAAGGAKP